MKEVSRDEEREEERERENGVRKNTTCRRMEDSAMWKVEKKENEDER